MSISLPPSVFPLREFSFNQASGSQPLAQSNGPNAHGNGESLHIGTPPSRAPEPLVLPPWGLPAVRPANGLTSPPARRLSTAPGDTLEFSFDDVFTSDSSFRAAQRAGDALASPRININTTDVRKTDETFPIS